MCIITTECLLPTAVIA